MTVLLLCLAGLSLKPLPGRPAVLDCSSDPYASEFVFVTTPFGIYTFNRSSETWGRITRASGLPQDRVNALALDNGIIWAATDSGVASADARLGDWQTYDLPGAWHALAFDRDYAWAGGDSGLRRFDKQTEEWRHRADFKVNDLLSEKGDMWIAAGIGAFRYSSGQDRVDELPVPAEEYRRIIATPGRVWFLGQTRFAMYRRSTQSFSLYGSLPIDGYATAGDSVFVVSGGLAFLYEPGSDAWVRLGETEELRGVQAVSATGADVWLATDSGLTTYNQAERSKTDWSRRNGLVADSLLAVYADQRYAFAVGRQNIQVLDRQRGTWTAEKLSPARAKRPSLVFLDDAGAHLRLMRDSDIRLSGRIHYSLSMSPVPWPPTPTKYDLIGLSLGGQHRSGRALSLYYDDSDEGRLPCGLTYRGTENDVLHRIDAGQVESEYGNLDLIPGFTMLGGSARLRRAGHALELEAGDRRSSLHSEYFTGRSTEKAVQLTDKTFARNVFYSILPAPSLLLAAFSSDTVFVDDRNPATNDANTRTGYTVGGITGDFDVLRNGLDYFVDDYGGVVQFITPRRATDVIVLATGEPRDYVLQSDSVADHVLRNTYSFGPGIVPGTFKLAITDTAGNVHRLGEFGLDEDDDGQVDPARINCDLGYLTFPRPIRPDTAGPALYKLAAAFESRSSFYGLTHKPIVKTSETVRVDGEALTRGLDYVIDYTSGILLFLRQDVVSDFSQIDVQYSSLDGSDLLPFQPSIYSLQPDIAIASGIRVSPGYTRVDDEDVLHLSGKAEAGTGTTKSLRFTPQFAVSRTPAANGQSRFGIAQDYSLAANYGIAGASARYQGYGSEFNALRAERRRYGPLRNSVVFSAGVEPLSQFRLDGAFQHDNREDTMAEAPPWYRPVQYLSGRLSYLNQRYPNGYVLVAQDRLPDGDKLRAKLNAGYELNALRSRLKLNGIVHSVSTRDRFLEYVTEAGLSLPIPVQARVRYRHGSTRTDSALRAPSTENELRLRLNVDAIPGLFYTGAYNLESDRWMPHRVERLDDQTLDCNYQNTLQVAPGRWWTGLSVVNFTFGAGSDFEEHLRRLAAEEAPPFMPLSPYRPALSSGSISSVQDQTSLYGIVTLNPSASLTIRAKRALASSGLAYYGLPELKPTHENEVKVEYEANKVGMLTGLWNRRTTASWPVASLQNVYFEWSMPWSELLRTRFTTSHQLDEDNYLPGFTTAVSSLTPSCQAQFRFGSRSYATLGFGVSRRQSDSIPASSPITHHSALSLLPSAGLNLNLFQFLYLQFDYQSSLALSGTSTHTLTGKVTGQF